MRVLLVDDSASMREAMRELVAGLDGLQVVGEAGDGAEALEQVAATRPDLVLMDLQMPVMDGIESCRHIRDRWPDVRVVAMTSFDDVPSVSAMIGAGASGYLLKTAQPAEIVAGLLAVRDGRMVLDPGLLPRVLAELARLYRVERGRAEQLSEVDRAKRAFFSLMGDHLRSPITAIAGMAATLRGGWDQLDEATRAEFLQAVDSQSQRLGRRLEQLLAASEITLVQAVAAPFDLAALTRELGVRFDDVELGELIAEGSEVLGDRSSAATAAITVLQSLLEIGSVCLSVVARPGGACLRIAGEAAGMLPEGWTSDGPSPGGVPGEIQVTVELTRRAVVAAGGTFHVDSSPDALVMELVFPAAPQPTPQHR